MNKYISTWFFKSLHIKRLCLMESLNVMFAWSSEGDDMKTGYRELCTKSTRDGN